MSIAFRPLEANLTHDTELIGRMDPYVLFIVGDQKIKSQVCKKGGKHPIWDDCVTIPFAGQPLCLVEVRDKDILIDDRIGYCEIDLNEIQSQGRLKKWYPLLYKEKPAGELLMEASFNVTGLTTGPGLAGTSTSLTSGMPLAGGLVAGHGTHGHTHGNEFSESWTKGVNPVGGILPAGTYGTTSGVAGQSEQYAQQALLGGVDPLHSQEATMFNQQFAPNMGVAPIMGTNIGQNIPLGSNITQHIPPSNLTQNIPMTSNIGFSQPIVPGPIFTSGISPVLGTTNLGSTPLTHINPEVLNNNFGTAGGVGGFTSGVATQANRLAENVGIQAHNMGTPGTHVHSHQAPFGHGQMGNP